MFEGIETERILMPKLPIYARLDGKSFHTFTRGMKRPYDINLSQLMVNTTKHLVEKTNALIGYVQSDEISLVWNFPEPDSEPLFGGRIMKVSSILAGMCSSYFTREAIKLFPDLLDKQLPAFDCRVINLPSKEEATNMFLWREIDATKNAISMAARAHFSHKRLQNKSGPQMQEMLFQEHGINFNDYPAFFKRGTWVRKVRVEKEVTEEDLKHIPEKYRQLPVTSVIRSVVKELDMPSFRKVTNRTGVVFHAEDPITNMGNETIIG